MTAAPATILNLEPLALKGRKFWLSGLTDSAGGRISIYEPPIHGHVYVVGADFAYGLLQGDYDAACVIDKTHHEKTGIARQVGEVQGKYGERFDVVLYALLRHYNDAFLLGERQVGLFTLRRLWDKFDHKWMYLQRSENRVAQVEEPNPELGWPRSANDLTLRESRRAVLNKLAEIRSPGLLAQLSKLQWVNRTKGLENHERDPDERLQVKLKGGGSPDLAIAWMYAMHALSQVYLFDKPEPVFAPGTYGEIFKLQEKLPEVFGKPAPKAGWLPNSRGPAAGGQR